MKIIINRAVFRFRPTAEAVIPALPATRFCGNRVQGPIRCEFRDSALTIVQALTILGKFPGMGQEFDVAVPLDVGAKSFAQAIQYAMDCSCDDNRSPRLPHHDRAAVQDRLLQLFLPREARPAEVEFALSPAKSTPSEWTVVNLSPDGLNDAREHARVQASAFARLAP